MMHDSYNNIRVCNLNCGIALFNTFAPTTSELAGYICSALWCAVVEVARVAIVSLVGVMVGAVVVRFLPRKVGEGSGQVLELWASGMELFLITKMKYGTTPIGQHEKTLS